MPPPPSAHGEELFKQTTTFERREVSPARSHRSVSVGPPRVVHEERRAIFEERSDPLGQMALVPQPFGRKGEREIRAEIKALEAEKEALRAERRAQHELRKAERIRYEGRESGELILYEEDTKISRHSSKRESEGVRIEKDKKGRMKISIPKK